MKYTKGPWDIAPKKASYRIVGKEGERLKAYGLPVDIIMVSVGSPNGQVAAIPMDESSMENAYLIAAVPEMYEALQYVAERVRGNPDNDFLGDDSILYDMIKKAIAKGEG